MIVRKKYLDQLVAFQDTDLVKVVTGVRRCGKSTLLDMMAQHLVELGVSSERIINFKMESMELADVRTYRELYNLVIQRIGSIEHPYLFFDELQEVAGWEKAINGLRTDVDCDIYITGSNAYLLSSELSTLLSGRYVEVEMLPLTFAEYLDFRGMEWYPADSSQADLARSSDGAYITLDRLLSQFREYGGLPFLSFGEPDRTVHRMYCKGLYDTVMVRDIMERDRRRDRRRLASPDLLERTCRFLANNIGNENSVNSIAGALRSQGAKAANDTVDAYIGALCEAYLFYPVRRYDIKGKEYLKTNGKHYIVDCGLRSYLEGYRGSDQGHCLENMVYLQLLYDGYEVSVGKLRSGEVDFVADGSEGRLYVQVTENMSNPATMERELAPLRSIRDAYPKAVVTLGGSYPREIEGIKIVSAVDFFLHRRELG